VNRLAALRSRDLTAAMALVLIALIVGLLPIAGWLRALVLLPAVLFAPGYAISAALFPPETMPRDQRLVLSIVFSISATALGGLLAQVAIGLDRTAFAAIVFAITIGTCAVAGERRRRSGPVTRDRFRLPRINLLSVVAIVLAGGIAAWGIKVATHGVYTQRQKSHFSSLWMVPNKESPSSANTGEVRLGVSNHEAGPVSYRLGVARGTKPLKSWRFRLDPGQRWSRTLATPRTSGAGRLVGSLYRNGAPYETVSLEAGGTGG
jgi:Protein of unknown function (DUF1616)